MRLWASANPKRLVWHLRENDYVSISTQKGPFFWTHAMPVDGSTSRPILSAFHHQHGHSVTAVVASSISVPLIVCPRVAARWCPRDGSQDGWVWISSGMNPRTRELIETDMNEAYENPITQAVESGFNSNNDGMPRIVGKGCRWLVSGRLPYSRSDYAQLKTAKWRGIENVGESSELAAGPVFFEKTIIRPLWNLIRFLFTFHRFKFNSGFCFKSQWPTSLRSNPR